MTRSLRHSHPGRSLRAFALTAALTAACIELKPGDVVPPATSSTTASSAGGSDGGPSCAAPCLVWSQRFGGIGEQIAYAIATNDAGDVFVTGEAYGELDLGGGPLADNGNGDIFVAAYRADGTHKWSKRFGGADSDYGTSISAGEPGGLYLTGVVESGSTVDFGNGPISGHMWFLLKLDAETGDYVWHKDTGGAFVHVAANTAGDVVLGGQLLGTADLGGGLLSSAGGNDVVVVKLGSDGGHQWGKRFGDAKDQVGTSVAVGPAGDVLIAGGYQGNLDFGGGQVGGAAELDCFVASFDASGGHVWSKGFHGITGSLFQSVALGPAGEAVAAGVSSSSTITLGGEALTGGGGYDIILAKLDASGGHVFSKRFGDEADQTATAVAVDGEGHVLLTGYFQGSMNVGSAAPLTGTDSPRVFLVKLDAAGNDLYARAFGEAGSGHQATALAVGGAGDLLVTGTMDGAVDFGGGLLTSMGDRDIFVAKFER